MSTTFFFVGRNCLHLVTYEKTTVVEAANCQLSLRTNDHIAPIYACINLSLASLTILMCINDAYLKLQSCSTFQPHDIIATLHGTILVSSAILLCLMYCLAI